MIFYGIIGMHGLHVLITAGIVHVAVFIVKYDLFGIISCAHNNKTVS